MVSEGLGDFSHGGGSEGDEEKDVVGFIRGEGKERSRNQQ